VFVEDVVVSAEIRTAAMQLVQLSADPPQRGITQWHGSGRAHATRLTGAIAETLRKRPAVPPEAAAAQIVVARRVFLERLVAHLIDNISQSD
jgi:hypothetical protein